jgi:alkylation response protein AidB-like acyl-CoA dehydrogenase
MLDAHAECSMPDAECSMPDAECSMPDAKPPFYSQGSDVAGLRMTAHKTPDGKHFVVNGVKKWITGGMDSDWFVTAVRTGGPGMGGISLLLIPRVEGLETKLIKTSYSAAAGTSLVIMENVLVPVENLIGQENKGFAPIMNNFNHERWTIIVGGLAASRCILRECVLWANQRKVFGKALITQPVIMAKIAEMTAQIEACSAWVDSVTYQMQNTPYSEQVRLAGPIALLKYYSTRMTWMVGDHAAQIFGGRSVTRGGMGQQVERFCRGIKYSAIYGGSEEIMQSLAVKQMMKFMPPSAKL